MKNTFPHTLNTLFRLTVPWLSLIFLSFQLLSAQTVDVKVSSVKISETNSVIQPHQSFIPSAVIGNLGSETLAAVPVRCEIMNTSGSIVYLSDQTVWFLPPHEELPVIFDAATGGLPAGAYSYRVSLQLVNDANATNDRIIEPFATTWDSVASMNIPREGHTANLLRDGRVLVAGGDWPTMIYNSCEIYTPAVNNGLGRWDTAASMPATRSSHTATMLPDGRILVAGGVNASYDREASCEIFDPTANSGAGAWKPTASMAVGRTGHTATLLKNGKVLITGGWTPTGTTSACELFDPSANNGEGAWSSCMAMNIRRDGAAAALLDDGRVLVTGGTDAGSVTQSSCEVFDPMANNGNGSWTLTASMGAARATHNAVPLANGKVLVTGGNTSTCEIYDPSGRGQWTMVEGILAPATTAALLPDGRVVVTGQGSQLCQIFDPEESNGRWVDGPMTMNSKSWYTSTVLSNGSVLIAGGNGGGSGPGSLRSCELFDVGEAARVQLPARLAVTTIFPETLIVHRPFTVVVEARDDSARPQNVSVPTIVRLACAGGSGSLHGELTGTIPAGENRIRFTDVAYDMAQEILRVCASTESGMSLLPDTSLGVFVGAARVPIAPKVIEANPGNRKVTLTWQKNPEKNIARYLILQGTHPDTLVLVDSTAGAHDTTMTMAGLVNDSLYYFCVIAVDSDHVQSPRSSIVEGNPALFSLRMFSGLDSVGYNPMAWGDFNGDGLLDVALSGIGDYEGVSMYATLYRNAGHGMLRKIAAPLVPVWGGNVEWCDYNNDNMPDIFLAGLPTFLVDGGSTRLYRNMGNDQFSEINTSLSGFGTNLASADYDNDGRIDVILSGWGRLSAKATLYHNEGGNNFAPAAATFTSEQSMPFSWIDIDNDGDLDLIPYDTSSPPVLYRNDGPKADTGWTFTKVTNPFPSLVGNNEYAAWGDYDNDGDLDVVIVGWTPATPSGVVSLYKNDGKGSFVDAHATGLPVLFGSVDCGDYDGDGKIDLAFSGNSSSQPSIYRNMGNFSFAPAEGSPRLNTVVNVWGDYDNDGDLDLLGIKTTASDPMIPICFQNNLESHNTRPSAPSGLRSVPTAHNVKLSWQRATDNETPSRGLSYNLSIGTTRGGCEIMSPMANLSTGMRYVARLGNVDEDTAWVIRNLPNGRYYWTVQAIDPSYAGSLFAAVDSFTINVTEAGQEAIAAPRAYALAQNFPNPFNPSTTIRFSLPSRTHVSLKIYDALGREVSSLVSEEMTSGTYSRQWNAGGMPSGVYFYRLQAGAFTETKRMIILK